MARVVVFFKFADGDTVQAIVDGKTSYPDALAQIRSEAVTAFKQAMDHALGLQAPKDEPAPTFEDES